MASSLPQCTVGKTILCSLTPSPVCWISLQGIFLVYDISSERSYQHIMKWASDVDEVGVGSEPLVLPGGLWLLSACGEGVPAA